VEPKVNPELLEKRKIFWRVLVLAVKCISNSSDISLLFCIFSSCRVFKQNSAISDLIGK
jgi:hypothetical protein